MMPDHKKGILLASITAILWGILAIAVKVILQYFDPETIIWFRFTVAFIFQFIYISIKEPKALKIFYKPPPLIFVAGLCLACNYLGFHNGVNEVGPNITQVLMQMGPITLGLIGIMVFKEKITPLRVVGFAIAGVGFALFYKSQLNEFIEFENVLNQGVYWIIFAASTWTCYAVINKILVRKWSSVHLNLFIYGLPALIYLPFADLESLFQPHSVWIWALLIFAAFNTIVAYGSLSAALKYTDANKVSLIITLNPIITLAIMEVLIYTNINWFVSPAMTLADYLGAFMILSGATLAIGIIGSRKKKSE